MKPIIKTDTINDTKNAVAVKLPDQLGYLLNKFDTLLQIHAEINEGPFNAFTLIFFLFQNEHVMVKELLQFFISEIDAKLFETVELIDFCFLKNVLAHGGVMVNSVLDGMYELTYVK